ncbi:MAG: chromate transporter [Oscillospiraceae bacterium]|nr:chromate transporter [Oscillospiraceae bacterium]
MIYLELFLTFFMIGAFTFGGGYAMLPLMQEQVALRWGDVIGQETIINFVAVSESTPGPFAVNMATYVGSEMGGLLGSACATLGVVLPSFIVILIVAKCYDKFRESFVVKGCMSGLKPAVVGLIGGAILSVAAGVFFPVGLTLTVLQTPAFYLSLGIFVLMLVLAFKKLHPIILILISAAVGIGIGYLGLW